MISSLVQRKDKESLFSKKFLVFVSCFLLCLTISADNVPIKLTVQQGQLIIDAQLQLEELAADTNTTSEVKFKRGKAILFTVFTGLFGGHRIYLGTHQRTPILYAITLGGLGILPLIDLVNIIFTKDLSKFEGIPQIIMWGR
tara:strand:+ start:1054 stop:1479 length:426 start_codon:yes stop_codon:yes gene_type:complete